MSQCGGKADRKAWQWLLLAVLALAAAPFLMAEPAHAYTVQQYPTVGGPNIDGVREVCPGVGLARRIVPCIKENVLYATFHFLVPFVQYISRTIVIALTLAIALWGTMAAMGKTTATMRDLGTIVFKVGIVIAFISSYGTWFSYMLDAMDGMLNLVASYAMYSTVLDCPLFGDPPALAIWNRVDCAVDTLVGGVYSTFSLTAGITGFLVACLFSKTVGFFIGILGFYLIIQLLFALARALYIYVSAFIAFAVLMVIAPLFVPLVLFKATYQYFEKWLKLVFSFILQPIILFAYLSMLLAAFDAIVYTNPFSLARSLAGASAGQQGFKLGWWLSSSGAYYEDSVGDTGVSIDPGRVARELGLPDKLNTGLIGAVGEQSGATELHWRTEIYNWLGIGNADDLRYFKLDMPVNGVNWDWLSWLAGYGVTQDYIVVVLISFMMSLIVAYIFMTMLEYLPYISSGIAGRPMGMSPLGAAKLAPPGTSFMGGMQQQLISGMGGGKK